MAIKRWDKMFVYGLKDPRTGQFRYVGQTYNPVRRLKGHIYSGSGPDAKTAWIDDLKNDGEIPEMVILQECDMTEVFSSEINWISRLGQEGHPLLNVRYNEFGSQVS